jgi:hypothetical protein
MQTVSSNPAGGHFAIGRTRQNLNNPPHISAHLQGTKSFTQKLTLQKEPKMPNSQATHPNSPNSNHTEL